MCNKLPYIESQAVLVHKFEMHIWAAMAPQNNVHAVKDCTRAAFGNVGNVMPVCLPLPHLVYLQGSPLCESGRGLHQQEVSWLRGGGAVMPRYQEGP